MGRLDTRPGVCREHDRSLASWLADRQARADFDAFDKIMRRRGGEQPRAGDETAIPVPEG